MRVRAFRWACVAGMALLMTPVMLDGQRVITEPRATLRPAGKGQKPFDVTRHTIPIAEITDGGPPRDGIRALADLRAFFPEAEIYHRRSAARGAD